MEVQPLVFIAPRGLITILLFLAILPADKIPFLNQSIIIQVILMTTIIMMIGVMLGKKDEKEKSVDSVEEVTV
jgi:hypothetical protein